MPVTEPNADETVNAGQLGHVSHTRRLAKLANQAKAEINGRLSESSLSDTFVPRGWEVIDVRDYGVQGDGTTNDHAALIAAIADLPSSNFILRLRGAVMPHDKLEIVGKSHFMVEGPGVLVKRNATPGAGGYLNFTNCTNFTVRDLTSRYQTDNPARDSGQGIQFIDCINFGVHNVETMHTESIGIKVLRCKYADITGNYVHDTTADGIGIYGACDYITISGNQLVDAGDDAIATVGVVGEDAYAPRHVSIVGNVVEGSDVAHAIVVAGGEDVTIQGNTCDNTSAGAIYIESGGSRTLHACRRVSVTGNVIRRANQKTPTVNQGAINVLGGSSTYPCEDVTILGNVITGARYRNILVGKSGSDDGATARVTIVGNEIYDTVSQGIYVQNCRDTTINSNTIVKTSSAAIYLTADARGTLLIVGNLLKDVANAGSQSAIDGQTLTNITSGLITGNLIECAAAIYGIDIASTVAVYGNHVVGGTSAPYRGGNGGALLARGNLAVGGSTAAPLFGGGVGVVSLRNASTLPSSNTLNHALLYAQNGIVKARTQAGAVISLEQSAAIANSGDTTVNAILGVLRTVGLIAT